MRIPPSQIPGTYTPRMSHFIHNYNWHRSCASQHAISLEVSHHNQCTSYLWEPHVVAPCQAISHISSEPLLITVGLLTGCLIMRPTWLLWVSAKDSDMNTPLFTKTKETPLMPVKYVFSTFQSIHWLYICLLVEVLTCCWRYITSFMQQCQLGCHSEHGLWCEFDVWLWYVFIWQVCVSSQQ